MKRWDCKIEDLTDDGVSESMIDRIRISTSSKAMISGHGQMFQGLTKVYLVGFPFVARNIIIPFLGNPQFSPYSYPFASHY